MSGFVTTNEAEFESALREAVENIKAPARATSHALAERIAERARAYARRAPDPTERDEPHLADSIAVNQRSKNITEIRVHSDHAYFLEFGTSEMPPHPYMRRAIEDEAY